MSKSDPNVGTGLVGAPACGDVMKLQILVDEETGIIQDVKFKTFGWDVHEIDGHDHQQILNAVKGISLDSSKPTMVVSHTVKGKGISFMEDDNNWHYRIPTVEEVQMAKTELGVL